MNTQHTQTSPNQMKASTDTQAGNTTLSPTTPYTAATAPTSNAHEQQKELSTVAVLGYN